jgi:hypothetical protein
MLSARAGTSWRVERPRQCSKTARLVLEARAVFSPCIEAEADEEEAEVEPLAEKMEGVVVPDILF